MVSQLPHPPLIIADSSPLIALALLDLLPELAAIAQALWIPQTVYRECTNNLMLPGAARIQAAITEQIITVTPDKSLAANQQLQTIASCIDIGEAQAIATALDQPALLLMDDKAGRRCAGSLGLPVIGSLGVLIRLTLAGRLPALRPLLSVLEGHGYWYHPDLIARALEKVGENNETG